MAKKSYDNNVVNTVIGSETELKGELHSQGSIRVDGRVEGVVIAQGDVHIGENSYIEGNVHAKRVIIAGEIHGNIESNQGIKICSTGKVFGNISGDRLMIEEGGINKGKVNMDVISSKNLYEGPFELVK